MLKNSSLFYMIYKNKMMKYLGFYREYYPNVQHHPSICSIKRGIFYDNVDEILAYLNGGKKLFGVRSLEKCALENESWLPSPIVYTDGEYVWTSRFIHYIEKHKIEIPKDFLNFVAQQSYIMPDLAEIGNGKLDKMKYGIRLYMMGSIT